MQTERNDSGVFKELGIPLGMLLSVVVGCFVLGMISKLAWDAVYGWLEPLRQILIVEGFIAAGDLFWSWRKDPLWGEPMFSVHTLGSGIPLLVLIGFIALTVYKIRTRTKSE